MDLCDHTAIILQSLAPREVEVANVPHPVVIYTDGASDSTGATWGAIVLDVVTRTRLCFAGVVPDFLLEAWAHLVGEQLICQIEMYAVLCIRWNMRHLLHQRRLILFIDNEPCRYALIKGRSPSDPLFRMAHACSCIEAATACYVWYERVCSYSNPADLPSRRKHMEACEKWSLEYKGDIALPAELLSSIVDGIAFPKLQLLEGDLRWVMSGSGGKTPMTKIKTCRGLK